MNARLGLDPAQVLRSRLFPLLLALVAGTVFAVGIFVIGAFDRAVAPELNKRTRLIGTIVRAELQRALELGAQLQAVAGLDKYLSDTLAKFSEVDAIEVLAANGSTVAVARRATGVTEAALPDAAETRTFVDRGSYALPILDGNLVVGEIRIDTSPTFVRTRLREVFLDVTVIALVAALVAVELTLVLIAAAIQRPFDRVLHLLDAQRAGDFSQRAKPGGLGGLARAAERFSDHADDLAERWARLSSEARAVVTRNIGARIAEGRPALLRVSGVGDIRPPLFLYVISTEVAVAFLPVYSRTLARPDWLAPDLAAAAPLVCYLVAIAILTPFGGRLSQRFGARRLFLWCIPATVLSLTALAMATHVAEIALWRGVMAAFYATATIACQEYAFRASPDTGSTKPMGAFVAVVYGGVFCGAALGGVIAGRFGFPAALFSGAAFAVVAGVVGAIALRGTAGDPASRATPIAAASLSWRLSPKLISLLFGVAVPMSATTAVFVWYLTPLMLTAAGSGPAEVARVVMLYYFAVILFGPAVTVASDGRAGPRFLVVVGATVAGLALLSLSAWSGFWAVTLAMALLGIGHTVLRAPLYAFAQRSDPSGASLMPLRLCERVGAILGLGLCAFGLPALGPDVGIRALAVFNLLGVSAFVMVEAYQDRRSS